MTRVVVIVAVTLTALAASIEPVSMRGRTGLWKVTP